MQTLPDGTTRRHLCRIPELAVVEAQRTGCPLVHAVTLLDLESSGGLNVFGRPKTDCGMLRGTEVTEDNYRRYRDHVNECGTQGVGPLQLTWLPLADRADELGGAWRPECNVRAGLDHFAGLAGEHTVRDAYSLWRYGRVEAQVDDPEYTRRAMTLVPGWQKIIDGQQNS